jgi:hypothetical protein
MPITLSFAPLDGAEGIAYTILIHLASVLSPVGGATTAIVLCTLLLRLALLRFTLRSPQAALLQLPFLFVLGRLFFATQISGHGNLLLHNTILGVPLGAHLLSAGWAALPVFGVLALVLVLLAGWSAWRAGRNLAAADQPASALVGVFARLLPFASVFSVVFVPLAAGVYVATSFACGNVEATLRARRLARQRK